MTVVDHYNRHAEAFRVMKYVLIREKQYPHVNEVKGKDVKARFFIGTALLHHSPEHRWYKPLQGAATMAAGMRRILAITVPGASIIQL